MNGLHIERGAEGWRIILTEESNVVEALISIKTPPEALLAVVVEQLRDGQTTAGQRSAYGCALEALTWLGGEKIGEW